MGLKGSNCCIKRIGFFSSQVSNESKGPVWSRSLIDICMTILTFVEPDGQFFVFMVMECTLTIGNLHMKLTKCVVG